MVTTHQQPPKRSLFRNFERLFLPFVAGHGAPIVFALLLLYVLWWGHTPPSPNRG